MPSQRNSSYIKKSFRKDNKKNKKKLSHKKQKGGAAAQENKLNNIIQNVFASNIIYLQVLIDSLHADKKNLEKIRLLSNILNYNSNTKIAQLHKTVQKRSRLVQNIVLNNFENCIKY